MQRTLSLNNYLFFIKYNEFQKASISHIHMYFFLFLFITNKYETKSRDKTVDTYVV